MKHLQQEENISRRKQSLFVLRTLSWVYFFSIKIMTSCDFIGDQYKKTAKLSCIEQDHLEEGNIAMKNGGEDTPEEELTCGNSVIVSKP